MIIISYDLINLPKQCLLILFKLERSLLLWVLEEKVYEI